MKWFYRIQLIVNDTKYIKKHREILTFIISKLERPLENGRCPYCGYLPLLFVYPLAFSARWQAYDLLLILNYQNQNVYCDEYIQFLSIPRCVSIQVDKWGLNFIWLDSNNLWLKLLFLSFSSFVLYRYFIFFLHLNMLRRSA